MTVLHSASVLRSGPWVVASIRGDCREYIREYIDADPGSESALVAYEDAILYISGLEAGLARFKDKLKAEATILINKITDEANLRKDKPHD